MGPVLCASNCGENGTSHAHIIKVEKRDSQQFSWILGTKTINQRLTHIHMRNTVVNGLCANHWLNWLPKSELPQLEEKN